MICALECICLSLHSEFLLVHNLPKKEFYLSQGLLKFSGGITTLETSWGGGGGEAEHIGKLVPSGASPVRRPTPPVKNVPGWASGHHHEDAYTARSGVMSEGRTVTWCRAAPPALVSVQRRIGRASTPPNPSRGYNRQVHAVLAGFNDCWRRPKAS